MCARASTYIFLIVVLFVPYSVTAQSVHGTIKGTLALQSGEPVPKATVIASALEKGELLRRSVETDHSGYFILNNLPSGPYRLTIRKDGFKTYEEPLIPVSADTTSEVNVKLAQGNSA